MSHLKTKIFAVLICVILVLSIYAAFVYATNDLFREDFVKGISLTGTISSKGDHLFAMGETMLVSTKVQDSNYYRLSICDNSDRLAFEAAGVVNESTMNIAVPIESSNFSAGQIYNLTFVSGNVNYPLPGMISLASSGDRFAVLKSQTILNLTSGYDESTHAVHAVASLLTTDLLPVQNETVNFYIQPNIDFAAPNRGWTFVQSVQTDNNGTADYSFGTRMMGGTHGLKAKFAGDQDYGSSSAINQFNVSYRGTQLRIINVKSISDSADILLQLTDTSGFPLGGKVLSFEAANITSKPLYAVTNSTGYATMTFNRLSKTAVDSTLTVLGDDYISKYKVSVRLVLSGSEMSVADTWGQIGYGNLVIGEAPSTGMTFSKTNNQHQSMLTLDTLDVYADYSTAYDDLLDTIRSYWYSQESMGILTYDFYINGTYQASVESVGTYGHGIETYTYEGDFEWYPDTYGVFFIEVYLKDSNGTLMAYGNTYVTLNRAYDNLIVYYPQVFDAQTLNMTVAFARARTYAPDNSSYYSTTTFAPIVTQGNDTYAVDQNTTSAPINLYMNDSLLDTSVADQGLYTYELSLNTSSLPFNINISAVMNATDHYQTNEVIQISNYNQAGILDDPTILDDPNVTSDPSRFYMNYSMSVLNGTQVTYINSSNQVNINVLAFNSSVYNVTTNFSVGYLKGRYANGTGGNIAVPATSTLLRVVNAAYPNSTASNPANDINRDGVVNMHDISIAIALFNKKIDEIGADYTADVNGDGIINMKDIQSTIADFNKHVYRCSDNFDYRQISIVYNGTTALYPDSRGFVNISSSGWINISYLADAEFFNVTSTLSGRTNNGGTASMTWNPPLQGFCVVEAWINSPLNLIVAGEGIPSQMNASLRLADYRYILKRPIDLPISWDAQSQSTVLAAASDTFADQNHPSATYGSSSYLRINSGAGSENRTFIYFDLSSLPANIYIVSARLNLYTKSGGGGCSATVYMATQQWNEQNLNWANQPTINTMVSSAGYLSFYANVWSSIDVTNHVRYWTAGSSPNDGFAIYGSSGSKQVYSRDYSGGSFAPSLEISYLNGSRDLSVIAYDSALNSPRQGLTVNLKANGTLIGSSGTDQSGIYDYGVWVPSSGGTWNVTADSAATDEIHSGYTSDILDLGLPTNITSLDDGSRSLQAGVVIVSNFSVSSSGKFNVSGVTVSFYVTGTFSGNGSAYSFSGNNTTSDGFVSFAWNPIDVGTFSVHASFSGDANYMPCDGYALASVNTLPLSILFSVSPTSFLPGDPITLNATIINPLTNSLSSHNVTVRFMSFSSDGSNIIVADAQGYGIITCNTNYPNDGQSHAYMAIIENCNDPGVSSTVTNLIRSPVQLIVGMGTTLTLNIKQDAVSSRYIVQGQLIDGSSQLVGKSLTLTVNDTKYAISTGAEGWFSKTIDCPAINSASTTYAITGSYSGEGLGSMSVNSTAIDGTNYCDCTTSQYSYKPCSNNSMLTILPQSGNSIIPTESSEEMQQQAKDSGWMPPPGSEFSIFYPWFRLHYKLIPNGNLLFDVGLSVLPLANVVTVSVAMVSIVVRFLLRASSAIVSAIALSEMIAQIVAIFGPEGFLGALIISTETKLIAMTANWNSADGLISVALGAFFSAAIGYFKTLVLMGISISGAIASIVHNIGNLWNIGFGALYSLISVPMNIVFLIVVLQQAIKLGVTFP